MGEYAKLKGSGQSIKIGTCEDMYYLRADQARKVQHEHGNVDPIRDATEIRFRFPFPDEDDIQPGDFNDHRRGLVLYRVKTPKELEHYTVQFHAPNGYLVSLPCPEGMDNYTCDSYRVALNGYGGAVALVQQRLVDGLLVAICECRGCGAAYRLGTLDDCKELFDALASVSLRERRVAEVNDTPGNLRVAEFHDEVARRIRQGYEPGYAASLGFPTKKEKV